MGIHTINMPSNHRHVNSSMHGLEDFNLSSIERPSIISDGSCMSCCSYTHKELFRSRRTKRKWRKIGMKKMKRALMLMGMTCNHMSLWKDSERYGIYMYL